MTKRLYEDRQTDLLDFEPDVDRFYTDVVEGLSRRPRTLPCKYFYDEIGSQLFDQICELDEYYLTRAELSIMQKYGTEMAHQIGGEVMLVEYGSGSSVKTRILLDALVDPVAYVPVDISRDHMQRTADRLAFAYPEMEVLPVCADFTQPFELPKSERVPKHNAVYFPGSTIGNFLPSAAATILRQIVDLCGCGGGLLIGIDLQKDPSVIEAAYNDAEGVTAAFNLNLLQRINRELGGNIRVEDFEHRAIYNALHGRVDIDLVSRRQQKIEIGEFVCHVEAGEAIRTEFSHKYTIASFQRLASEAGLLLRRYWTDEQRHFAVLHFVVDGS